MSDFDVDTLDMDAQFPSDSDADAIIAGRPVEGVPPQLGEMVATMRRQATSGPSVPPSSALTEFIVERTPAVTPIGAGTSKPGTGTTRPFAKKAAAALAIVPAKLFIGATMAAAAVGGAQALGVVDVPLLPGPEPVVVTSVPVETVAPTTASITTTVVTTTVAPSSAAPADTPASTATTMIETTVPSIPSAEVTPVTSATSEPAPAAGEPGSGCDFGQETSGRADGASRSSGPGRRSDAAPNSVAPPVDPCERGTTERTQPPAPSETVPSAPIETLPSGPADPGRGNGAPASVPVDQPGGSSGGDPANARDDNPGNARSNDAAADRGPASGQGGNDDDGGGNGSTSPSPNSERGRTPRGD